MSKTNDTSKLGHATLEDRTLDDIELDAVTGGIIAILIGLSLSDARPSTPPPPVSK